MKTLVAGVNEGWSAVEVSPRERMFWWIGAGLVIGNLVVPQLFHAVALGGATWLPIFFFTLVGSWCFGWRVGVLAGVVSPLLNAVLFGMPAGAMVGVVAGKSVLLALGAGLIAKRGGALGAWGSLAAVLAGWVVLGTGLDFAVMGGGAVERAVMGWPGMVLMLTAGFAVIWGVGLLRRRFDER